jgi:hypothetical protein
VIAYLGEITRVKAQFDTAGLYVWQCHILSHEDNEMMVPFCVGDTVTKGWKFIPGNSRTIPALHDFLLADFATPRQSCPKEFDIQAPADLQLEADRTLVGVRKALDKVLTDSHTDLVVTLGPVGSHAAAQRTRLPKPTVAPFISNHGFQDLPYKDGASGKHNLSYVSLDVDIRRDLTVFQEIVPFTRLALLLDSANSEAIPGIHNEVVRVAQELGIRIIPVLGANEAVPGVNRDRSDLMSHHSSANARPGMGGLG